VRSRVLLGNTELVALTVQLVSVESPASSSSLRPRLSPSGDSVEGNPFVSFPLAPTLERGALRMSTVLTEVLTEDAMVKIAREQISAFNNGDWERLQAGLAADCRYDELGTARTIAGPEQIVELFKGWKQAFPDAVGTVTRSEERRVGKEAGRRWRPTSA